MPRRLTDKGFVKKFSGAPWDNHELAEQACGALVETSRIRRAAREYLEAEDHLTRVLEDEGFELG